MDCKDVKKHIQEYLDGDADLSAVSAHLEQCNACRAYLRDMQKQKEMLGALAAKNAPTFDLAAAKRRKKAKFSRAISWASAAAAVFVVVLLAGSMTGLFSGAKKEAPMMVRAMGEEAAPAAEEAASFAAYSADEEAAPAEAEEVIYEGCIVEEAPAEEAAAPMEEAPAEEAIEEETADEAWQLAAAVSIPIPEDALADLLNTLEGNGIPYEVSDDSYVLSCTDENTDIIQKLISPYTDAELSPYITVYLYAE